MITTRSALSHLKSIVHRDGEKKNQITTGVIKAKYKTLTTMFKATAFQNSQVFHKAKTKCSSIQLDIRSHYQWWHNWQNHKTFNIKDLGLSPIYGSDLIMAIWHMFQHSPIPAHAIRSLWRPRDAWQRLWQTTPCRTPPGLWQLPCAPGPQTCEGNISLCHYFLLIVYAFPAKTWLKMNTIIKLSILVWIL